MAKREVLNCTLFFELGKRRVVGFIEMLRSGQARACT